MRYATRQGTHKKLFAPIADANNERTMLTFCKPKFKLLSIPFFVLANTLSYFRKIGKDRLRRLHLL